MHFTYQWSDYNSLIGMIVPINESIWEHTKMGFYSVLFFALFEYLFIGKNYCNYMFAKVVAAVTTILLIPGLYYFYTLFIHHNLWIDILIFIISVVIAQYVSYRLLKSNFCFTGINFAGLIILFIVVILYSSYTFAPPKVDLFKDSQTNSYGITQLSE